jgi:small subunit ribosomal protein S4
MARESRPIVKLSRREGYALHPKAHKILLERQFSKLMEEAGRTKGQSGSTLLEFLERRLDNAIYRAGFAPSRTAARQLSTHGHFMLNGRRVDVPSMRVNAGDKIELRPASKKSDYFKQLDETSPAPANLPGWLKVNRKQVSVEIIGKPSRDDAEPDIKEQLIVEYYSR